MDTLQSIIGCDSMVYSNLIVYPIFSDTNNQTICSGELYSINGNVYDTTGIYLDTLLTSFGCDSIIITNLFVDSITGGSSINVNRFVLETKLLLEIIFMIYQGVFWYFNFY